MSALRGIRARLLAVALVLLALPFLAAQIIVSMETFLRRTQEEEVSAMARAASAGLSDRPALFERRSAEAEAVAEERRRIVALFAAADPDAAAGLGNAYAPSEEIERFLGILGRKSVRMWVVDTRSRVRGLSGNLKDGTPARRSWLQPIAAWLVPSPAVKPGDETRPVRSQVDRALIGVTSTEWRGTRDRDVAILSAAQPVFVGDDIVGAVVVEETTGAIQIQKQRTLEKLLVVSVSVVAVAMMVLLAFAGRLAARIRRLHVEADAAIDPQGRVRGTITPSGARDEIGDLSRTMAAVLQRLRDYNAHLEAMASRLSHELRTPVAVVRSSLDNLKAQPLAPEARVYVERADEGVGRLARLISRLSEATRLERMLEAAEQERFDLARVVAGCVEGYRAAYAPRAFEVVLPTAPVWMQGVPDAIAQALDKLVENAQDFAPAGTPIRVALRSTRRSATLSVENAGPPLPANATLFGSMGSMREGGAEGAHLGLGLFIVRLVAEAHGGRAWAENLANGAGVRFVVEVNSSPWDASSSSS